MKQDEIDSNGFRFYHYKLTAKNSDNDQGKLTFKSLEINYLDHIKTFLAIQLRRESL